MQNISLLAKRPRNEREVDYDKRRAQLTAAAYLSYIVGSAVMFATGIVPMVEQNDSTSFIHGWIHGYFVLPEFIASVASSDYTIYQVGGGALYNFFYLLGIFYLVRNFRILLKK